MTDDIHWLSACERLFHSKEKNTGLSFEWFSGLRLMVFGNLTARELVEEMVRDPSLGLTQNGAWKRIHGIMKRVYS